jgi:hypothetical protein
MTENTALLVTGDYEMAEEAISAANVMSCDGYWELDIDAVAQAFARHRQAAEQRARIEGVKAGIEAGRRCVSTKPKRFSRQNTPPTNRFHQFKSGLLAVCVGTLSAT